MIYSVLENMKMKVNINIEEENSQNMVKNEDYEEEKGKNLTYI